MWQDKPPLFQVPTKTLPEPVMNYFNFTTGNKLLTFGSKYTRFLSRKYARKWHIHIYVHFAQSRCLTIYILSNESLINNQREFEYNQPPKVQDKVLPLHIFVYYWDLLKRIEYHTNRTPLTLLRFGHMVGTAARQSRYSDKSINLVVQDMNIYGHVSTTLLMTWLVRLQ